jgi:hypothetical protein
MLKYLLIDVAFCAFRKRCKKYSHASLNMDNSYINLLLSRLFFNQIPILDVCE